LFKTDINVSWKKNHIFNNILSSFFMHPEDSPLAPHRPFGLVVTKRFSTNQTLMSFPLDMTPLVIDGQNNVPSQLTALPDFKTLSIEARTCLSISLLKVMSESFGGPLSLLWKGVGVRPIPDVRWVSHRPLFAIGTNSTGIEELDRLLQVTHRTIEECLGFIKAHYWELPSSLTDAEVRWSWLFLNIFGISIGEHKALVAPLIFARRSIDKSRSLTMHHDGASVTFSTERKLERGDEILIDASNDISDGFAYFFQGSWVADDSIHRGRFWLRLSDSPKKGECLDQDGLLEIWLSNDELELTNTRERIHQCVKAHIVGPNKKSSPSQDLRVIELILKIFRDQLKRMHAVPVSEQTTPIKFQYFNLMYNEVVFWETKKNEKIHSQLEL
jgi:hypothetical protein